MKNTPCQQYILENPDTFFQCLTDTQHQIAQIIFDRIKKHGNTIPIDQCAIANELNCTVRTVSRAFKKFRDLGVIFTTRRFNASCIVTLTKFFKIPKTKEALKRAMRIVLPLSLIFCPMFLRENVPLLIPGTSSPDSGTRLVIKNLDLTRCPMTKIAQKREKGYILSQMSPAKLEKIADIEAALVKRGLKYGEFDISKLFAFSEECLDDAISTMKHAKPKEPFGFFLSRCFLYCKWNNIDPDYNQADVCRSLNILDKYKKSQPAKQTIREQLIQGIKTKEPQRSSYSQQVKEDMARERAAAEARMRRFNQDQLVEEIAGMKWHVENLTERATKGEPGASVALMIAKNTLARREHELNTILNPPNTTQISTEAKVVSVSNTNTAPPTQIVQHMANLFVDGYTEEESDEDISD